MNYKILLTSYQIVLVKNVENEMDALELAVQEHSKMDYEFDKGAVDGEVADADIDRAEKLAEKTIDARRES